MIPELIEALDRGPAAARTRGVVKSYRGKQALAGLDLTVPEGAVYVLVGPNGAGKTTALKVLLDLIPIDAGAAEVLGLPVSRRGAEVRAQIGWVPEDTEIRGHGSWRVGELLAYHAAYYPAWDPAYARQLAALLEVSPEERYGRLSKGQARRVQLVMALAHRPPLLLLDEPTDGLDPLAQDQVLSALADHLAAAPTTVLISTHRVHEVEGLGEHLGVLRGGRLVAQLPRERLGRHLHRVRAEVAEGWAPPAELPVLGRSGRGREVAWTLWGEAETLRAAMTASGATVRAVEALNLEEACRALLAMAEAPAGRAGKEEQR